MVLTIDIGNTNICLGKWDDDKLKFTSRIETAKYLTADSYAVKFKSVLELYDVNFNDVEGSIISSVVPEVTIAVSKAIEKLTGKKPMVVGPGIKTGLDIRIDNPAELGSDIVADAVGVIEKYPKPIIFFDLGTATTACVIDENGCYLGGAIMPGVRTGINALSEHASQLPHISIEAPKNIIGKNTVDSMKSGAVFATASMIDGMAARIQKQLNGKASIVATGGNSKYIVPFCNCGVVYDGHLLIDGLMKIYRKNVPQKL